MTHHLRNDGRHDGDEEESTRIPRGQARFIMDSAKWIMALLLTLAVPMLGGGGYMITLQMRNTESLAELRTLLHAHSEKMVDFSNRLTRQENLASRVEQIDSQILHLQGRVQAQGDRMNGLDQRFSDHTKAIITAEGLLNTLSQRLADIAIPLAENAANHVAIERRLNHLEDGPIRRTRKR